MSDTIAAVATGSGISAVGIIRISGNKALTVADNMFRSANGMRLYDAACRQMYYGELVRQPTQGDGSPVFAETLNNNSSGLNKNTGEPSPCVIDLCLCVVSRAPNSYTGEDTVEFHCHGSPVVLSEVLQQLFKHGVRQALPGEFTKRAFLSGRMDLTQAEAVIDLIESETTAAAKNAAGQLQGMIGLKLSSIYNNLLDIMTHFHAVLDYPDEDIDEFNLQTYLNSLQEVESELQHLLKSYEHGKVIKNGIPTAIIGRPNTGKSSLLNALLGFERAIVTDVAGTTRDTIEEKAIIGNVLLRLIDTAGLRHTENEIEKLGVERTVAALSGAELVILVLDGSQPLMREDYDALHSIPPDVPKIAVVNKSDLPAVLSDTEINKLGIKYCSISALSGEGLTSLDEEIKNLFPLFAASPEDTGDDSGKHIQQYGSLITNARQADALTRSAGSINEAITALTASVTPDAVLVDIESALSAIGEITGKNMREDIISGIFERFCVGK
ncbi:MAG: tRNA uridine-5-carboxymethylaminomethyl(34) synthesis GTPase MnmE [Oscillospiraceae bacterium]|nr:tRNA uridine-5-carboxymethylaminomethyl(34) synthesis GTPase MnmE [Oscillospiraceae bacterium]